MSYTGDSPILGNGRASAAAIDAWFRSHNQQAPALGASIIANSALVGANSDLVAAQIALETGYWTSQIAKDKRNPAGLGAINSDAYGGAITFPTSDAGIRAQVAHLGSYAIGQANPLKADDPRYPAMPASVLGVATVLSGLDGRWAVPGQGYGQHIATLANALVAFAQQGGFMAAGQGNDPQAAWQPSSNFDSGRGGVQVDRIILHTTEGGFAGSVGWLRGAAGGSSNRDSSAHYVINAAGATIVQLVNEADTAWAAGVYAWNQRSINIEQEGYASKGGFSDGLYAATAGLVARIAARHNLPLDRAHVIGHGDVPPPNNHTDPGPSFDFDRLLALAQGAATVAPSTPARPAVREDPVTGMTLGGGFRDYYEWLESKLGADEALMLIGRPLTNEFKGTDGVTRQAFERAVLSWQPGSRPQRWDVLVERAGADWLASHPIPQQ